MTEKDRKQLGRIALQRRNATSDEPGEGQLIEQLKGLSEKFGVPAFDLGQICLRLSDLEFLPREIAEQHTLLPVLLKDERLFVAMADPSQAKVIDELEFVTGKRIYAYVAQEEALVEAIKRAYTLRGRGERFYIGERCPADVLAKLGIDSEGMPIERPRSGAPINVESPLQPGMFDTEPLSQRGVFDAEPPSQSAVLVDDLVDRPSHGFQKLDEAEFYALSDELSGVNEVPTHFVQGFKTILVVDDENEIRQMLKTLLASKGHTVIEATTGSEALRKLTEYAIDLVVLDAMLPEIHGFDIARRIKATQRWSQIPIVMISAVYRGWRFAEDLRESCGVEHYIEKPFKIGDVLSVVETALREKAQGRSDDSGPISNEAAKELHAGVEAYREGKLDIATTHLKRGLAIDPNAYRLHYHLGLLYGKQGRIYEAIGALERAVEINSRHYSGVKILAVLYQKAGFRNKAVEMWERALKVAPDHTTRQSIKEHLIALLQ
jgi:DNA-binding response OmpR family regulator